MKANAGRELSEGHTKTTDTATLKLIAGALLNAVDSLEYSNFPDISGGIHYYDEVRNFEARLIRRALRLTHGSQKCAALLLGLSPTTLNSKIKSYSINRLSFKAVKLASVSSERAVATRS